MLTERASNCIPVIYYMLDNEWLGNVPSIRTTLGNMRARRFRHEMGDRDCFRPNRAPCILDSREHRIQSKVTATR